MKTIAPRARSLNPPQRDTSPLVGAIAIAGSIQLEQVLWVWASNIERTFYHR